MTGGSSAAEAATAAAASAAGPGALLRVALPVGALILYCGLLAIGLYALYSGMVPLNELLLDVCALQRSEFGKEAPSCDGVGGGF